MTHDDPGVLVGTISMGTKRLGCRRGDIWITTHFTTAAEAKATVMFFSSQTPASEVGQYNYGTAVMVAPGLGGNFGY